MPTTEGFRAAINARLEAAEAQGLGSLDIQAGELHRALGGYPARDGSGHQMPMCCAAMRSVQEEGDEILRQPPKGDGASLTIRFMLPRSGSPSLEVRGTSRPLAGEKIDVGARVQHETAKLALPIIARKAKAGGYLTYQSLATALGRSPKHARAMAQVCDLLDSAAALARRPLMALWTVRTATKQINPQAWATDTLPGLREALLKQAEEHSFSDADEAAILSGLDKLAGIGNRRAWLLLREFIPQEEMLACLQGKEPRLRMDTLNDLGTDEPPELPVTGTRYARDPAVREAVMRRARGMCEYCGTPGFIRADGTRYLECHHIIALSRDGRDRMANVIALCPGHHREAHFGEKSAEMESRMAEIVRDKEKLAKPKGR